MLRALELSTKLFPPLSLPPLFTRSSVLELITVTTYSLAFLKFDYLFSRLIARLSRFSHISFMTQQLHWLPFNAHIAFKVLFLVLKPQLVSAPKYLCDSIRQFALSDSSLHSSNRHDLLIPRVSTTMGQTRSFAFIGSSLWNCLPPSLCSFPCLSPLSCLKSYLFLELKCTASVWVMQWEVLNKCPFTIQIQTSKQISLWLYIKSHRSQNNIFMTPQLRL